MRRTIDETGNKYNRWVVIRKVGSNKYHATLWLCRCICGTERVVEGRSLRSGNTQSCGCLQKECVLKGNKHPVYGRTDKDASNWRGGITSDKSRLKSGEYKQWRTSIFERDNYTCQSCNEKGGNLNAHHILRWSKFKSLRYTLANGITLCKDCHKVIHSKKYNDQPAIHKFLISKIKEKI